MRTLLLILLITLAPLTASAQTGEADGALSESPDAATAPDDAGDADADAAGQAGGLAIDETVLWTFDGGGDVDEFRAAVKEALAADAVKHLLDDQAFREWLATRSALVPRCFTGVEDCVAPGAVVFDALGLSSLLHVTVERSDATWRIVDGRGQVVREGEVAEPDVRKRAFMVVAEIFDATGVVTIETEPAGATIELDGRTVGTTPFTYRVGVGPHTYRLRLQDHRMIEGTVEIASGRATAVRETFDELPGSLTVVDAPERAEVYVNGQLAGRAGTPISLQPGSYTLEVRAEGFEPFSDAVVVEPGLAVKRSATMREENVFLRDISSEAIAFNNYILRLGLEMGVHQATFQDARTNDDEPTEFVGFANDDGVLQRGFQRTLGSSGLRLDAAYGLKNFALVVLSMSYLSRSLQLEGFVDMPGTGVAPATITRMRRLQLRPFQVYYRQFFKNFVPFLEGGIGINFLWLQAEGADLDGPETLRRTDAFWTIAVGAQYYFTEHLFGMLRYSYQDYFENGLGSDHQISVGVGAAFPNVFGLDTEPPEQL